MKARPADENGDVMPVLAAGDLRGGAEAVANGLKDHLKLFPGDWWERPEKGNPAMEILRIARGTAEDARTLTSCVCSYMMRFPGVRRLEDAQGAFEGGRFAFSCTVHTDTGESIFFSI